MSISKIYLMIVLRITIFGVIGMFWTFIPELLRDFFGDTICSKNCYGFMDSQWEWGARHYWYFWTMFLISVSTIVFTIIELSYYIEKKTNQNL